jgi:flagellar motor switch protein FliN
MSTDNDEDEVAMVDGDGAPGTAPGMAVPLQEMEASAQGAPLPPAEKTAEDLEAVFDVPVRISVILGRARIPVAELLQLDAGTVVELDRQVGEAVDIYVNDRLVARGEIVLVENRLGVTMTEIIKAA